MNLDRLAQLAAEATPGPWWHQVTTACYDVIEGGDRTSDSKYIAMMGTDFDGHDTLDAPNGPADAAFIAAANPSVVLALVEVARAAQRLKVEAAVEDDFDDAPFWEAVGDVCDALDNLSAKEA